MSLKKEITWQQIKIAIFFSICCLGSWLLLIFFPHKLILELEIEMTTVLTVGAIFMWGVVALPYGTEKELFRKMKWWNWFSLPVAIPIWLSPKILRFFESMKQSRTVKVI